MTSGISIFFGKLFKLDKCCERQKEESQLWLGGVLSQACWRNVQGSQLSAVVILMLRSQTTMAAEIFQHKRHFSNTTMGCEGHLID